MVVRVPEGATHLFVSAADCWFPDNVDADGNYRIEITCIKPEASFIIVPIHGQVPDVFPSPPDWLARIAAKASSVESEINSRRDDEMIPLIQVRTVQGNWATLTSSGYASILSSRLLFLLWEHYQSQVLPPPAPILNALFNHAMDTEAHGRYKTSAASLNAARLIAAQIRSLAQQIRDDTDDSHPIYVDVIGHSRGGAVSGEVIRRLGFLLSGNVEITWTILDGIDPSPGNMLERPLALAGDLLGDPLLNPPGPASQISNFYADAGLLTGFAGVWGQGYYDQIELLFGPQSDAWLVQRGYPLGRSRAELGTLIDSRLIGTSHNSLVDQLVGAFESATVGVQDASINSLLRTTRLGEVIQNPLARFGTSPRLPLAPTTRGSVTEQAQFAQGDTALIGCEFLQSAMIVATYPELRDLTVPELSFVFDDIDAAVAAGFPTDGAWTATNGSPSLDCISDPPAIQLSDGDTIQQELLPQSVDASRIEVSLLIEFELPDASLVALVSGPNLESAVMFSEESHTPLGNIVEVRFVATRSLGKGCAECPDNLAVSGSGVRVLDAAATAFCPGDSNRDGIVDFDDIVSVLANWLADYAPGTGIGDADGTGVVDFDDVVAVLSNWLSVCE